MRAFFVLSLVCMVGLSSASVSISNVGTAGAGDSEDNPAEVGESVLGVGAVQHALSDSHNIERPLCKTSF